MLRQFLTTILLTFISLAIGNHAFGQETTDINNERTIVSLTAKNKDVFFMRSITYYEPYFYRFNLKKGQKVEIEIGWTDFNETNQKAPGFKVFAQNKKIEPSQRTYILTATRNGGYVVGVALPFIVGDDTRALPKNPNEKFDYKIRFRLL